MEAVKSVPPILAVYPDKNWKYACSSVSLATGGRTPLVSQVKKIILEGWGPTDGIFACLRKCRGNAVLAFGVMEI